MQALLCLHNFACACSRLFLSVAWLLAFSLSLFLLSLKFVEPPIMYIPLTFLSSLLLCTWLVMWIRLMPFHHQFIISLCVGIICFSYFFLFWCWNGCLLTLKNVCSQAIWWRKAQNFIFGFIIEIKCLSVLYITSMFVFF